MDLTSGNDTFTGDDSANSVNGLAGDDVLQGAGGDDTLYGGEGEDFLFGEGGSDILFGYGPDDVIDGGDGGDQLIAESRASGHLYGGLGDDTFIMNIAGNLTIGDIDGGDGFDRVYISAGNFNTSGMIHVELIAADYGRIVLADSTATAGNSLTLWGSRIDASAESDVGLTLLSGVHSSAVIIGGQLADSLTGYIGRDVLRGGLGNDTLAGEAGDDLLTGGPGDNSLDGGADSDTAVYSGNAVDYVITDHGDGTITVAGADGTDTLSSVRWLRFADQTLAFLEPGRTVTGGPVADILYGGDNDDTVSGLGGSDNLFSGDGNDLLLGGAGGDHIYGGLGADTMAGGTGDDAYYIDNAGDRVLENASEGNDYIYTAISFRLGTQYVENLTLTGSTNLTATGNALANTLNGNSGNNVLNGGNGMDSLWGGAGDDTYLVDNVSDRTFEKTTSLTDAGGHDTVYASVRVTLDQYVEDLVITGAANLAGTGNALDNTLTGNSGNNILTGKDGNDSIDGGAGADVMAGGLGNDTYVVDSLLDRVVELTGQGNDVLFSSVGFSLGNQYIETLTLTGGENVNATGNGIANILSGNGGNNILDGGQAADILTGGAGADIFRFGLKSGADTITDFSTTDNDTIDIHAYSHGVVNGSGITIAQSGADTVINLGGGNMIYVVSTIATDQDFLSHIVW